VIRRSSPVYRWAKAALLGTVLMTVLGACTSNAPQDSLNAKGSVARQLNHLFVPVFWIAVAVFVLVGGLVTFCIARFRARSDDEAPRQIHGNTRLELTWTIMPAGSLPFPRSRWSSTSTTSPRTP
jgi:cytochrome c oxidase subunit 2